MLFSSTKLFSSALIASIVTFHIGLIGLSLNRDNILKILMSLELLMLSVNLNFILFSAYLDDLAGQVFVIFVLALSAAESAVGLTILSTFYDNRQGIKLNAIKSKSKNLKL